MKGDRRRKSERQTRYEAAHAGRQVELFRDRLLKRGSDPATEAVYREAQGVYQEKARVLEDSEKLGSE